MTQAAVSQPRRIYEVVKYPEAVLMRRAREVSDFNENLRGLVEDMFESMYAAQGIGLAAPQIGVSQQITTIDTSFQKDRSARIVLINPHIISRHGSINEEEGCLSLPEIREKVRRAERVRVRAQDVRGEWFELDGDELLGRAFQHEIDHLHGVLFIDHLSRLKRDLVMRRIRKLQKNGEW